MQRKMVESKRSLQIIGLFFGSKQIRTAQTHHLFAIQGNKAVYAMLAMFARKINGIHTPVAQRLLIVNQIIDANIHSHLHIIVGHLHIVRFSVDESTHLRHIRNNTPQLTYIYTMNAKRKVLQSQRIGSREQGYTGIVFIVQFQIGKYLTGIAQEYVVSGIRHKRTIKYCSRFGSHTKYNALIVQVGSQS